MSDGDGNEAVEFRKLYDVSRETIERFHIFSRLLVAHNSSAGLIARSTVDKIWGRHFNDCAQILDHGPGPSASWLDIGTGGGFPGMVLAILSAERQPEARFTLVEPNDRKCQFLRRVAAETEVRVEIACGTAERIDPRNADAVTARALAPLARLLGMTRKHVADEGLCMFPKGANRQKEIDEARESWRFSLKEVPSRTDPRAAILLIREIARA